MRPLSAYWKPVASPVAKSKDADAGSVAARGGVKREPEAVQVDDTALDGAGDCGKRLAVAAEDAGGGEAATRSRTPSSGKRKGTTIEDIQAKLHKTRGEEHRHRKKVEQLQPKADNFDFALPENLRDSQGRPPTDPEYDGRTILVPQSRYLDMTPFERQFWDVKRALFDTVVFFRKGIFYELFEADAHIASKEFGLAMTHRASMVMCGMPAGRFEEKAGVLLAKGYKVARVDQAESHVGLEKRMREGGRAALDGDVDKLIKRTVTEILTPGTLQDPQLMGPTAAAPCFVSVWQGTHEGKSVFGVCIVETATHTLRLGSFEDNARLAHLETLLLRAVPKEALLCKDAMSQQALHLLRARVSKPLVYVRAAADFWEPDHARRVLQSAFNSDAFPDHLRQVLVGDHAALRAAGGALKYLEELSLLKAVLSSLRVQPCDALPAGQVGLDGTTLLNLDILDGPCSLLTLVDHTSTACGARLLRQWVSAPLVDPGAMAGRLDAVDALRADPVWTQSFAAELRKVPDLERLVALCAVGTATPAKLCALVLGLMHAWQLLVTRFQSNLALVEDTMRPLYRSKGIDCATLETAARLDACVGAALKERLWSQVANWQGAVGLGYVEPAVGADDKADAAREQMAALEAALAACVDDAVVVFGTHDVVLKGVGKHTHLLDVPVQRRDRAPKSFTLISSTKTRDRFLTPRISELVAQLDEVRDALQLRRTAWLAELQQRASSLQDEICHISRAVAQLDCFMSMVVFVDQHPGSLCRPVVLPRGGAHSYLEAVELKHPIGLMRHDQIANDISLGGSAPAALVITGPNMGGKSTLLRAVCTCAIMAHVGLWVPAQSFRMTLVDRVFTRIGARDDIQHGQSSFMVEMLETATVLNHATADSLVMVDELGRGTSTYDGLAVASASLSDLVDRIGCRTLFSTHYHSIADAFQRNVRVGARMMQFMMEPDANDATRRLLVFLYKLVPGVTPSSFGMNVARQAGVPEDIVVRAEYLSQTAADSISINEVFAREVLQALARHAHVVE